MPPILPRKRLRSLSPQPSASKSQRRSTPARKAKPTTFSSYDAEPVIKSTAEESKAFLDALSDDESSLSEADSDDFEDVLPVPPPPRRQAVRKVEESDEELEFEDVATSEPEDVVIPDITEDINIKVLAPGETYTSLSLKPGGKATATKKQKEARVRAHCMHVQFLLWHNHIRNSWINDKQVQESLVSGLGETLKSELKRWRIAMGYEKPPKVVMKGKRGGRGTQKPGRERIRDWGATAAKSEEHTQGDPSIRLLKYLTAYWKKRFKVTAPGLRKMGYRGPKEMREEMISFQEGPQDPERHGEHIENLDDFRQLAKKCHGSRDVGAQLFTALLRGLGIEARLVASLQPTGYGWTKFEEAHPRKTSVQKAIDGGKIKPTKSPKVKTNKAGAAQSNANKTPNFIDLASSDDSSMDVTTLSESEAVISTSSKKKMTPSATQRYDRDLVYPIYWTEVRSPATNMHIPISTLLNPPLATAPEHIANFEPRGAAAEKAKQVIGYVVAFSSDSTAKDVTVRYLRKRQWPGKTRGVRLPIEKIPIYNRKGKVLRTEEYDWFKHVMRGYARPGKNRTLADDIEDEGDLVPAKPEVDEKKKNEMPETLQGYKQSADFVLERHLRREEALRPNAKVVKHFHVGKGDKETKEPVYKRSDVVTSKTVETWHKEGREIKLGEQALKYVPFRAVTIQRKREIEDRARETGEQPMQRLYAEYQTQWIIPPPIENGVIPKNGYGNIDIYVPSMVPRGAVHIPRKGTLRVCKRLGIDYAEACTGFEFGKQRAVPVITGVVVAEEHKQMVLDAWREDEKMRIEKESKKRQETSFKMWKKLLYKLRIRDRMRREYGATDDEEEEARAEQVEIDFGGGGFLRDGEDDRVGEKAEVGGGFLVESEDESVSQGELEIIGGSQDPARTARQLASRMKHDAIMDENLPTPISLQALHADERDELPEPDAEDISDSLSDLDCSESEALQTAKTVKKTSKPTRKAHSKQTGTSERVIKPTARRTRGRPGAKITSPYFTAQ